MDFKNQIERIKEKLLLVKELDNQCEEFGSRLHRYVIGPVAGENEIKEFEKKYNIELPSCFRMFLTHIGNGGLEYENSMVGNSAAGPNYGIYKLGSELINSVADTSFGFLKEEAYYTNHITDEEWSSHYENMDVEVSDYECEEVIAKLYSGILTIGYCGCSGFQGIMLNGNDKGRVIYISQEFEYPPRFTEETNFLDWYEAWLDGIIKKQEYL